MKAPDQRQLDALEPLRRTLLDAARAEADLQCARAVREADTTVAAARSDAAAVLDRARSRGEAEAADVLANEHVLAGRARRGRVLTARQATYASLREQVLAGVADLLREPGTRSRLVAELASSLGAGELGATARAADLPDGGLELVAADGSRAVIRPSDLVDEALADLDLDQLWAR